MGRYYNGDIDGKFWFAVQSSEDADFFGVQGEARFLSYYFDEDNKKDVHKGMLECDRHLGKYRELLDDFFEVKNKTFTPYSRDSGSFGHTLNRMLEAAN